jgi:CspA family cold shock protein
MNLFSQLVVSVIAAAAATFAIIQFQISAPLQLGGLIALAGCISPILNKMLRSSGAAASPRPAAKKRPAANKSPAASKSPAARKPQSDDSSPVAQGPREEGEVKWFNVSKGFGFIRRDNDEEIFVHFRSILSEDSDRRGLRDGQRVSYVVVNSDKGPQAEEVKAL